MPFPKSPYTTLQTKGNGHTVYLDPEDVKYLKALVPFRYGLISNTLATLFHQLINELRSLGLDPANDDHRAWHDNHATLDAINDFLRRRDRRDIGQASPQHDVGGAGGLHQAMCSDAEQRADAEGGIGEGGPGVGSGEEAHEGEEEGQRRPRNGTPRTARSLLEALSKEGIL